jgi:hypothetical protein
LLSCCSFVWWRSVGKSALDGKGPSPTPPACFFYSGCFLQHPRK